MYVDAAFDRGDDADNEAYNAVARTLPGAPSPEPGDLASFTALRAFLERTYGVRWARRRTCGPGSAPILTEASVASGPQTFRFVRR